MVLTDNIENFILDNFPEATTVSGKEGEYQFNSPFYNDGKKRLYVNVLSGKWFDQKEQRGGNKFEWFVKEYLDVPYSEAIKILTEGYDYLAEKKVEDVIEDENKETDLDQIKYVKWFDINKKEFSSTEARALNYLLSRRIDPRGLGYIDNKESSFYDRIIIPFYENNELVYFIARAIDPNEYIRYKNLKNISVNNIVFNYDKIDEEVFIFEGVFDAMSLKEQVGTAILSNLMKEGQAKNLLSIWNLKRIIFVPDVDEKVKTRITILKNLLKNYNLLISNKDYRRNIDFYIYNIPDGYKDFNECSVGLEKDSISLDECEKFNPIKINFEIMKLTNQI